MEEGGSSNGDEQGKDMLPEYLSNPFHDPRDEDRDSLSLKRLRTIEQKVPNDSKVIMRVGPTAEKFACRLPLGVLVAHSAKVRRIVESTSGQFEKSLVVDGDEKSSQVVIDLPDFQFDAEIFRIVEDFCFHNDQMVENARISVLNAVRLLNAATFLEISTLAYEIRQILAKELFHSWEDCLAVLARFDSNNVPSATNLGNTQTCMRAFPCLEYVQIFEECLKALPRTMEVRDGDITIGCYAECLVRAAQLLRPNVAKHIYRSCWAVKFGLFVSPDRSGNSDWIRIGWIRKGSPPEAVDQPQKFSLEKTSQLVAFYMENDEDAVRWIERLPDLVQDLSRRSVLVEHLSKMVRLTEFAGTSNIEMGFLCALLAEAIQLNKAAEENPTVTNLDEEIVSLKKLVVLGLLDVCNVFIKIRNQIQMDWL